MMMWIIGAKVKIVYINEGMLSYDLYYLKFTHGALDMYKKNISSGMSGTEMCSSSEYLKEIAVHLLLK